MTTTAILSKATGTAQTIYTWNDENRLVGVQTPTGDILSYVYNSDGIRTSSTTNGVTTEYLIDANRDYAQVLEERVNGNLIVSYVYGRDLISQERGDVTSLYLVDGLGSTTALTDANGVVTDIYTYESFGSLSSQTGNTWNSYQFAGEQFDESLGEYYLRQRYYNTETGRFIGRDAYEGRIHEPLTLNKYLYAHANPVIYTDPSGNFTLLERVGILTILSLLSGVIVTASVPRRDARLFGLSVSDEDYGSADEAAIAVLTRINSQSIAENREYAGYILRYRPENSSEDAYVYTYPPRPGTATRSNPGSRPLFYTAVADYHTHGAPTNDLGEELFSPDDTQSNLDMGIMGYLATPRGKLLRFDPMTFRVRELP
jgi:RHS repeat-associated protein